MKYLLLVAFALTGCQTIIDTLDPEYKKERLAKEEAEFKKQEEMIEKGVHPSIKRFKLEKISKEEAEQKRKELEELEMERYRYR